MLFRYFCSGLCLIAAFIFLAVNSWLLGHFGWRMGSSDIDAWGYAAVSAATPWVVAILPFLVAVTWRGWRPSLATLAGCLVWLLFVVFNLVGAAGHISLNRTDVIASREHQSFKAGMLRSDLKRAEEQLQWIPKHRPADVVEAEIANLKLKREWKWTDGCQKTSGPQTRRFCDEYQGLTAELASSEHAAVLRDQIAHIQSQIAQSGAGASIQVADPQAAVLSAVTGYSQETVRAWLPLMLPVILELGSMTLFAFAMSLAGITHKDLLRRPQKPRGGGSGGPYYLPRPETPPALPGQTEPIALQVVEDPVRQRALLEEFFANHVRPVPGASVSEQNFYEHYRAFSRHRGVEPMLLETFRRAAVIYVPTRTAMHGETYYHDVVVAEPAPAALRVVA